MQLDLETFRVLDVVVTEGSFAKAAVRLNRAQSAVSYQIRKLEQRTGVPVFDRSGYRAVLTPEGEMLWHEGLRLLDMASRIENLASQFGSGWEPKLKLVMDGAFPVYPVMQALKQLVDQRVPTCIQLRTEFLGGVTQVFEDKQADLMLVLRHHTSAKQTAIRLPEVKMILVCASSHPLAKMAVVTREDLRDHVELTIQDTSRSNTELYEHLQFDSDRAFYFSDFVSKKNALLMALGFGWVPQYLIRDELNQELLVPVHYHAGHTKSFSPLLVRPEGRKGRTSELLVGLLTQSFAAFDW